MLLTLRVGLGGIVVHGFNNQILRDEYQIWSRKNIKLCSPILLSPFPSLPIELKDFQVTFSWVSTKVSIWNANTPERESLPPQDSHMEYPTTHQVSITWRRAIARALMEKWNVMKSRVGKVYNILQQLIKSYLFVQWGFKNNLSTFGFISLPHIVIWVTFKGPLPHSWPHQDAISTKQKLL